MESNQFHYQPRRLVKIVLVMAVVLPVLVNIAISLLTSIENFTFHNIKRCTVCDGFVKLDCNITIATIAMLFILPGQFIVPSYLIVYCFPLGKEFQVLFESLEKSPDIFGKDDSTLQK